jgi:hypothetical protein
MKKEDYNIFVTPIRVIDLDKKQQKEIQEYYSNVWDNILEVPNVKVKTTWGQEQPKPFCPLLENIIAENLEGFIERITNLIPTAVIGDHWLQEYNYGAAHMPHHHPGSIVSGVYYIESNNLGSPLVFYNPNNAQHFMNYATYSSMVECWQGRLVLFPSWLLHGVPECRNQETIRRVIAFNIDEDKHV